MPETRNSTNFLRALAIMLVVNSHMDALYPPRFASLATGGMMGNALFFLLSAWGLLLSMQMRPKAFGSWYGRRITRIYPAVWVTVVLLTFPIRIYTGAIRLDNSLDAMEMFFYPPFWFLQALMIYYVFIFFIITKFSYKRLALVTTPVAVTYVLYYIFLLDLSRFSIEGTPFRIIYYFLVILWGVYLASRNQKIQFKGFQDVFFLLLSIACIYGHKFLMTRGLFMQYQFIQHAASFPMLYFFVKVSKSKFIEHTLMDSRYLGTALTFISGATLEIFMVNNSIDFLDTRLGIFPLNVIALISINIGVALIIYYCAKPIRTALESSSGENTPKKVVAAV